MKDLPYLPEVICLFMIIVGIVCYFYSVNEMMYTTDYVIDPKTGLPYPDTHYYEITVYPYRYLGTALIYAGSLFLLLFIVLDKLIYKRMRNNI